MKHFFTPSRNAEKAWWNGYDTKIKRACCGCGTDITHRHKKSIRCEQCQYDFNQQADKERLIRKRSGTNT